MHIDFCEPNFGSTKLCNAAGKRNLFVELKLQEKSSSHHLKSFPVKSGVTEF